MVLSTWGEGCGLTDMDMHNIGIAFLLIIVLVVVVNIIIPMSYDLYVAIRRWRLKKEYEKEHAKIIEKDSESELVDIQTDDVDMKAPINTIDKFNSIDDKVSDLSSKASIKKKKLTSIIAEKSVKYKPKFATVLETN